MVDAAAYIYRKLRDDQLLTKASALASDLTGLAASDVGVVCVGHSLGAGTAAILAIMLREDGLHTRGFAFSPPGGTLR